MAFRNPIASGEQVIGSGFRSDNYNQGETGWRIGADGSSEFQNVRVYDTMQSSIVEASEIRLGGNDVAAVLTGLQNQIAANSELIVPLKSLIDIRYNGPMVNCVNEVVILQGVVTIKRNRRYRLYAALTATHDETSAKQLQIYFRYSAGASVVISSSILESSTQWVNSGASVFPTWETEVEFNGSEVLAAGYNEGVMRFGFTAKFFGVTNWRLAQDNVRLALRDIGPALTPQYVNAIDGGYVPPPPPPVTSEYEETWESVAFCSYTGSGAQKPAGYNNYAYQGDFGDSLGSQAAVFLFNAAAIRARLAGATILNSKVGITNAHSYYSSGLDANIGLHGHESFPATFTGVRERIWLMHVDKYKTQFSGYLGTALGEEFQDGRTCGLAVGRTLTGRQDYGYFTKAYVTIRFRK